MEVTDYKEYKVRLKDAMDQFTHYVTAIDIKEAEAIALEDWPECVVIYVKENTK